jgi:5-methylcytosine-specific restriction endonuclease McrA
MSNGMVDQAQKKREKRATPEGKLQHIAEVSAYAKTSQGKTTVRQSSKKYRENHPERRKVTTRAWRQNNPEKQREATRRWRKENPDRIKQLRRIAESARRARKLNQFVEKVDPQIVFDRDQGICGICILPIEGDFHVDHVIPLSKGGEHSYANTQSAHPLCNMQKKDKLWSLQNNNSPLALMSVSEMA